MEIQTSFLLPRVPDTKAAGPTLTPTLRGQDGPKTNGNHRAWVEGGGSESDDSQSDEPYETPGVDDSDDDSDDHSDDHSDNHSDKEDVDSSGESNDGVDEGYATQKPSTSAKNEDEGDSEEDLGYII